MAEGLKCVFLGAGAGRSGDTRVGRMVWAEGTG